MLLTLNCKVLWVRYLHTGLQRTTSDRVGRPEKTTTNKKTMATTMQDNKRMGQGELNGEDRLWNILRIVGWSMAGLVLLLPLVAMLFTDEVNWSAGDFLFAIGLLGGTGFLCELAIRRSHDNSYRTGVLLALAAMFLLVWSNAAVGFVGSGSNAANVLYFAMVAIPIIGGAVSGFKAKGMFLTLLLTAIVQAAITVFAFATDLVHEDSSSMILAINAIFILLWMGSAMLFHHAAESEESPSVGAGSNSNVMRRSPVQFVLSLLLTAIGAVMLTYMITAEDEPGAIPLLVFLAGLAWFIITLRKSRTSRGK